MSGPEGPTDPSFPPGHPDHNVPDPEIAAALAVAYNGGPLDGARTEVDYLDVAWLPERDPAFPPGHPDSYVNPGDVAAALAYAEVLNGGPLGQDLRDEDSSATSSGGKGRPKVDLAGYCGLPEDKGGPGPSPSDTIEPIFFRDMTTEQQIGESSETTDFNWIDPDIYADYQERGVDLYTDADLDQAKETEFRRFFTDEWPKPEYDFLRVRWERLVAHEDAYIRVMGKAALWLAVRLHGTQELIEQERKKLADVEV